MTCCVKREATSNSSVINHWPFEMIRDIQDVKFLIQKSAKSWKMVNFLFIESSLKKKKKNQFVPHIISSYLI